MSHAIRIPTSPTRGVNIECNAPLSAFNARIEKEVPIDYGLDGAQGGDDFPQRPYVPRAHESAAEQSEMALRRRQEKAAKINMFLVQTKARIISGTKEVQEADALLDDKTRRRLNQSWNLIPRSSTTAPTTKRNRVYGARPSSAAAALHPGGEGEEALLPASAIAIQLGYGVQLQSELAGSSRARESLLAHRRRQHGDETPLSSEVEPHLAPPNPHLHPLLQPPPAQAAAAAAAEWDKNASKINSSFCSQGKAGEGLVDGERHKRLREDNRRLLVYKEIRAALMQGERARVRELREHQEEESARQRAAEEEGRRREEEARLRALDALRLERRRQQGMQAAMAERLEAEKELEERVKEPQRQQLRKGRYREALRCRLLDTSTSSTAKVCPLCPCNPPRTVADGRVWLCANNCSLKDNLKLYHRLVRDLQSQP